MKIHVLQQNDYAIAAFNDEDQAAKIAKELQSKYNEGGNKNMIFFHVISVDLNPETVKD